MALSHQQDLQNTITDLIQMMDQSFASHKVRCHIHTHLHLFPYLLEYIEFQLVMNPQLDLFPMAESVTHSIQHHIPPVTHPPLPR